LSAPEEEDSGQLGDSTKGKPARCDTRGNSGDHQTEPEDSRPRGDPANESSAIPKDRWKGQPEDRPIGTAEGCEIRGDSKIHRRQKPEMQEEGQPRACIRGDAHGGVTERGNSQSHKTSTAEASRFGATRRSTAGTAKGRKCGATRGFVAGEAEEHRIGATRRSVSSPTGGSR